MKRICCGCGQNMGIAPGPEDQVTHGLCELCVEWIHLPLEHLRDQLARLQEHINRRPSAGRKEAGRSESP